jgi:hypothetical protein
VFAKRKNVFRFDSNRNKEDTVWFLCQCLAPVTKQLKPTEQFQNKPPESEEILLRAAMYSLYAFYWLILYNTFPGGEQALVD